MAPLSQVEEENAEITVVLLIRGPQRNSSLIASCYASCIAPFCKVNGRFPDTAVHSCVRPSSHPKQLTLKNHALLVCKQHLPRHFLHRARDRR
jgi:hypothetical protein